MRRYARSLMSQSEFSYRGLVSPLSVQIPRLAKPIDRVGKRLAIGPRAEAEVAFGFGRAEEHVMLGHAQAVDRRKRFASGEARHDFGGISDRHGGSMGNAQPRRAPADQAGDVAEHVGKQHVLAAENVALADDPAAKRREMSVGDVVDM